MKSVSQHIHCGMDDKQCAMSDKLTGHDLFLNGRLNMGSQYVHVVGSRDIEKGLGAEDNYVMYYQCCIKQKYLMIF